MVYSDWLWRCKHVSSSRVQGDMLYILSYAAIIVNQANEHLPKMSGESQKMLKWDDLVDDKHGIEHFWLDNSIVPESDIFGSDDEKYYLFAICDGNEINCLLQCYMPRRQLTGQDSDPNVDNRKFIIQQRRQLRQNLSIHTMEWSWDDDEEEHNLQPAAIPLEKNMNVLNEVIDTHSTDGGKIGDKKSKLLFFRVIFDPYLELDNKAQNLCSGISTHACNNPCSTCTASKQSIYSFPTPTVMSFSSRTTADTITKTALKPDNVNNNVGCQRVPIFDVPVHRQGPTTMHDFSGTICVIINTFQDFVALETAGQQEIEVNIKELRELQKDFGQITHLQDLQKNVTKSGSEEAEARVAQNQTRLAGLIRQYNLKLQAWQLRMETCETNNHACKFLQIMQKYHINLHYCMSGSLQGTMCGRICKAIEELITLAKEVDYASGILWEHLFVNLDFVYIMTKKNHSQRYDNIDLASIKYAYINLYHQILIVVGLWKSKGKCGMKIHYLMHDIEHCFRDFMSNSRRDDERFENVNQHAINGMTLYQGWNGNRYGCKEYFMARRLNGRVLSCG